MQVTVISGSHLKMKKRQGERSLAMKNKILSCINMVDIFFLALFISCMDSTNITIPTIGILIWAAWLLIYNEVKIIKNENI